MTTRVGSLGLGLLVLVGALAGAGCGGGDDDDDDDNGGSGGKGGTAGTSGKGGSGGSGESGPGLPSRLPEDADDCASATGADGCFFEECCAELVACDENAACAKTFGCYRDCPSDDSNCFTTCAGSALADGAEDFSTALSCALLAGCGGSEPGTGGTSGAGGSGGSGGSAGTSSDVGPLGTAEDELGWDLNVSDDPLTAELSLDTERAVSEEITLDGGTVTATAEDGTVFELTIPEGALYGPTVITLTPLLSFEVSSLDGATHGVQIEPDGLPLMASPTLEITLPDGDEWAVDQQLPLATTGEDNTVSLALLDPESEPLRLVLTHFSNYAVLFAEKGIDSKLSQADIRNRFGGAVEERLQSAASERLGRERMKQLLGAGEDFADLGLLDLFAEFEEHVLKPRIAMAGESCAAGKLAISTLLGVERQKSLLGFERSDGELTFIDLIPTVADVCMREEYEICRDEHIITRVLPLLYGYMRQAALLGLSSEIEGVEVAAPWVLAAEEYVKKCLQFELQLDSDVAYADDDATLSMSETVTTRVPFGLTASLTVLPEDAVPPGVSNIGALILGGPEPLESTSYAVHTNEPCRTIDAENPENGEFYVGFMGFTPGENSPQTPGGSAEITDLGISIAIVQNLSSYDFTQQMEEDTGCGEVTSTGTEVLSWGTTLGSHLLSNYAVAENGAWITGWKPVNSDIVATKDITLNESDGSYTSKGPVHLIVFHTPK